jgi:3',5'-cyclic AMP phosphodiesterase CpdA
MDETFTLAHFSDLQWCCPVGIRVRELLNKRLFGYLKWRLHRHTGYRNEILAVLQQDLKSGHPDHIVITGDLTHLSRSEEFRRTAKWLRSLGPSWQITVIPGNHDMYVKTAWENTFAHWADYMASDEKSPGTAPGTNMEVTYPVLRIRKQIAIIGVCTARPVNPLLAVGTIGKTQLQRLEQILLETGRRQLLRVVLIHHPPVAGVVGWRKRLTDVDRFRSVVKHCGAELILHGHAHRSCQTRMEALVGKIPVIGVPAASASEHKPERRARYHLYRFRRNASAWSIHMKVHIYSPEDHRFIPESEKRFELRRTIGP